MIKYGSHSILLHFGEICNTAHEHDIVIKYYYYSFENQSVSIFVRINKRAGCCRTLLNGKYLFQ